MDVQDEGFMRLAIQKAKEGVDNGQAPFGACIVKGDKVIASTRIANIIAICASAEKPCSTFCIANVAKINTGIYKGKISSDNITPPCRKPTVKAIPTAPIKLKVGVPSKSVSNNIEINSLGI